jgi:hypothetical protein
MRTYEIRILNVDRTLAVELLESHFSDEAAIRSAQSKAAGRAFEVWRDSECVWTGNGKERDASMPRRRLSQGGY